MNSYILIMTFVMGVYSKGSVATAEFMTLNACKEAGSHWLKEANNIERKEYTRPRYKSFYFCARKS